MTDIAVIMSVYRNDKIAYLKQSVQSILTQTYSNFYFFIAFDGPVSTEIETYITNINDERIKLYRIEENGGLARAMNFLLEIVLKNPEYKYIARMDADDLSLPTRFAKQYNFLMMNPDISCVGCWYQEIDENGKDIYYRKLPLVHESIVKLYYFQTPFAHPSVMYKISMIKKAGFYPTTTVLMEDNALWARALLTGSRFANLPEYLLRFRKDKDFYKRRSGFKYGWNFILTRFWINKSLNFPVYSYMLFCIIGIIKMMPSFILKYFYLFLRKHY